MHAGSRPPALASLWQQTCLAFGVTSARGKLDGSGVSRGVNRTSRGLTSAPPTTEEGRDHGWITVRFSRQGDAHIAHPPSLSRGPGRGCRGGACRPGHARGCPSPDLSLQPVRSNLSERRGTEVLLRCGAGDRVWPDCPRLQVCPPSPDRGPGLHFAAARRLSESKDPLQQQRSMRRRPGVH